MRLGVVRAQRPLDKKTNIPTRTFDLCRFRTNRQSEIIWVQLKSKYLDLFRRHITLEKIRCQKYQIDHYAVALSPSHSDFKRKGP